MQEELERIQRLLEQRLVRPSRWSGVLTLSVDPAVRGAKPFGCDIVINAVLAGQDMRWRTLLHEMLHTFSAGYNRTDFDQFPGWEEGVVEQCQRLLRPEILAGLGVQVDESVFKDIEAEHRYNPYIEALERVRQALLLSAEHFYLELLEVPIRDRKGFTYAKRVAFPPQQRREFFILASAQERILRKRL